MKDLQLVQKTIKELNKNCKMETLQYIKIAILKDKTYLIYNNLETEIVFKLRKIETLEDKYFFVPILEFLKLKDFDLALENNILTINNKKYTHNMDMFKVYPTVENINNLITIDVKINNIFNILYQAKKYVCVHAKNYILDSILIDNKNIVGTSGMILFCQKHNINFTEKVEFKIKGFNFFENLDIAKNNKIYYNDHILIIENEKIKYTTKLISGDYPLYQDIIPVVDNKNNILLSSEDKRRIKLFTKLSEDKYVKLIKINDELYLKNGDNDRLYISEQTQIQNINVSLRLDINLLNQLLLNNNIFSFDDKFIYLKTEDKFIFFMQTNKKGE